MNKSVRKINKEEARKNLLDIYKILPLDNIYVVQASVSQSGMDRRLRLYHIGEDNIMHDITYSVSRLINWTMNDKGLLVKGCGMDMHFHTVYTLASVLFGNGYGLKHQRL
jgi:hypothetical protein